MTGEGKIVILNLAERLAAGGSGVVSSTETEDLDINLVRFEGGAGMASHVNREVDVLMVVIQGEGTIDAGGIEHALGAGQAALIPKGVERAVRSADNSAFAYLSIHQRRRGLWPTVNQQRRRPGSGQDAS
jgi:quercetin dioxygenase-like cupin family protein